MKKLFNILIILFIFSSNVFAADEIEKGKTLLKSLSKKSLTKKETISFLNEYAVIIEDERGDGKVAYIFDDEKYSRYKGTEIISTDAWRFSKLGALRLFNKDIKMTWKIKISDKENLINIKTKFDPVGKLYEFEVKTKKEYLAQLEQIKQAEIQKKEAIEKAKIEKKKKMEQEKLAAEQKRKEVERKLEEDKRKLEEDKRKLEEERLAAEEKLEEDKRKLEEEKLALLNEIEELKKKKADELEQVKKTPEQIKKEKNERLKQEKLAAKIKAKEERERLKQEKLAAKKKAKEERERLKQEKLAAQKKVKEIEKKLKEEKIAKSKVKDEKSLNIEKHKLCMKMIEASFYQDWDNKIFKNKTVKKAMESSGSLENLKMVRMMLVMGSTNPTKRKGKYHWDDFAGMGMLQFCPPDQYDLELTDVDF